MSVLLSLKHSAQPSDLLKTADEPGSLLRFIERLLNPSLWIVSL